MRNITSIFITADVGDGKLMVISGDDTEDYFITVGFDRVRECWDFAKHLAKGYGLPEESISADIYEVPNIHRIK